jgi:hypothetical protein
MCYTQWVMAPAVALALYETPSYRVRGWTLAGCFCLVGFSSPFVLIATPFVVWKAYWERSRFALTLLGITAWIGIFYLRGMVERFGAEPPHGTLLSKLTVSASVLYRWLLGHNSNVTISAIVAIFTFAAIVSYLWANRTVAARPLYFLGYGLALLFVGSSILNPAHDPNQWGTGGRYFYIPIVLFIWTFIAVEQCHARQNWTLPRSAGALALLFVVHVESLDARFVDINWQSTAECLERSGAACFSRINPSHLNTIAIPSDAQLKALTPDELRKFRWGL